MSTQQKHGWLLMPVHAGEAYCAFCGIDVRFDSLRVLYQHVVNEHENSDEYWAEHARISHFELCINDGWDIDWFFDNDPVPGINDEKPDGWDRVDPDVIDVDSTTHESSSSTWTRTEHEVIK